MKIKNLIKIMFKLKYSYIMLIVTIITNFSYPLAFYSLSLLGNAVQNKRNANIILDLFKIFIIVLLAWGFYAIMTRIKSIVTQKYRILFRNEIRKLMIEKINSLEYSELKSKEEGTFISWFIIDIEEINSNFLNMFWGILSVISLYLSTLFFISLSSIYIGILCFIFSIVGVYLNVLIEDLINKMSILKNRSYEKYMSLIKNDIMGIDVYLHNNKQEVLRKRVLNSSDFLEKNIFIYNIKFALIESVFMLITLLPTYLIMLSAVILIIKYNFSYGLIFGVLPLINLILVLSNQLYGSYNQFRTSIPILEKYNIEEKEDNKIKENIDFNNIEVRNISFGYNKDVKIIDNLSLNIKYPNKYYVVGESGKGKTTLIKLIQGLYKVDDGEVLIDGINVNNISEELIRNKISYLTQDIYLFNASIRENITLWGNYSEEEIQEVIRKCQLEEYINSLEKGLDTEIEENGKNVSGGQKQRIGLARLLIRKLKYIIIDEGTSQLDKENARKIEDILLNEKDISFIIITHHLRDELKDEFEIINLS